MGLFSFLSSQFTKMDSQWVEQTQKFISKIRLSATMITVSPLYKLCEDTLNTPNINDTTEIIAACLVEGVIATNLEAGTGKINAFVQLICNKYPQYGTYKDEIEDGVLHSEGYMQAIRQMRASGASFEKSCVLCLTNWCVRKLCRADPAAIFEKKHEQASYLIADHIFSLASEFPR